MVQPNLNESATADRNENTGQSDSAPVITVAEQHDVHSNKPRGELHTITDGLHPKTSLKKLLFFPCDLRSPAAAGVAQQRS